MARPSHKPSPETRAKVEVLAAVGIRETDIATMVGVDPKTLRKHYRHQLDTGHLTANSQVAQRLFKTAVKGTGKEAVTACIFWLKTRAGWRETPTDIALQNPDGSPLQTGGVTIFALPDNGRD